MPSNIFSLHGRGLKLDTADDIQPLLKDVDPSFIEEIHLGGNTIGVGAAEALAKFLEKTNVLKARLFSSGSYLILPLTWHHTQSLNRSQISQTSSPAVSSQSSH